MYVVPNNKNLGEVKIVLSYVEPILKKFYMYNYDLFIEDDWRIEMLKRLDPQGFAKWEIENLETLLED